MVVVMVAHREHRARSATLTIGRGFDEESTSALKSSVSVTLPAYSENIHHRSTKHDGWPFVPVGEGCICWEGVTAALTIFWHQASHDSGRWGMDPTLAGGGGRAPKSTKKKRTRRVCGFSTQKKTNTLQ